MAGLESGTSNEVIHKVKAKIFPGKLYHHIIRHSFSEEYRSYFFITNRKLPELYNQEFNSAGTCNPPSLCASGLFFLEATEIAESRNRET